MSAKEMLEKVQELKERTILNGFAKPVEADEFWNEHWIQILDILDDALFNYLGGNRMSDLISRQDAIDAIIRYLMSPQAQLASTRSFKQCAIDILWDVPSAERKGKWIRITQGEMPEQYICPFCHRTVETYGVEELLPIRYPYCHCGADMRGEEE